MKIDWRENSGNFKVYKNLNGLERLTKRAMRRGMFRWGRDLKRTANEEILRGEKTGIVYIRRDKGGRRRRHQASAGGESHANRTGKLRRSIGWNVNGHDRLEFGYGVDGKDTPDYDGFVELGTFKMKPRPSLANAINNTLGTAEEYFAEELRDLNNES